MSLVKLDFAPTLDKDDTILSAKGRWVGMQWMRFQGTAPWDIGGYQSATLVDLITGTSSYVVATDGTIPGITRRLHVWFDTAGNSYLGAGSNEKLAVLYGGGLYDITPFRSTATYTNPFVVSSGSPIVTVALGTTLHGGADGDTVVFSGAGTVGGLPMDGPWVFDIVNTSTFTFTNTNGSATAASTGGGTAVVAEYEISIGNVNGLGGPGYGVGAYGVGFFGVSSANVAFPRTWSLSHFGQNLLALPRSGLFYVWTLNTTARAQPLSGAPSQTTVMFVSPERFVVACGTHDGSAFDPMLVRWSDQDASTTWTPAVTNQAGDFRLSEGSMIVAAAAAAQENLIWTDRALYAMRYLADPTFVYGFTLLGTGCGPVGPNAVAVIGGSAYWLSDNGQFWKYDGATPTPISNCPVIRYVFDAITPAQKEKIYACRNGLFNEIWFLYPADEDLECSNYVAISLDGGGWFAGTVARTAMVDAGIDQYPVMAGTDSKLYIHDIGTSADGGPIEAYIESAPFDIAEGQALSEVLGYIPDLKDQAGVVELTLYGWEYPEYSPETDGPYMFGTGAGRIDTRLSGRQMAFKLGRNDTVGKLRLGVQRLDVQALGERA